MRRNRSRHFVRSSLALLAVVSAGAVAQDAGLSFFVTSAGPGRGGDLGGLVGADQHCQTLATSVGSVARVWRAYLSASATGSHPAIHARDRIGSGPWSNASGTVVALNVVDLHAGNKLTKETALTERGNIVPGRGDWPIKHDILTGSTADGRAFDGVEDWTCSNWTSSNAGRAMVGHSDRAGMDKSGRSWNSSHLTPSCFAGGMGGGGEVGQPVRSDGLLYCFAAE